VNVKKVNQIVLNVAKGDIGYVIAQGKHKTEIVFLLTLIVLVAKETAVTVVTEDVVVIAAIDTVLVEDLDPCYAPEEIADLAHLDAILVHPDVITAHVVVVLPRLIAKVVRPVEKDVRPAEKDVLPLRSVAV